MGVPRFADRVEIGQRPPDEDVGFVWRALLCVSLPSPLNRIAAWRFCAFLDQNHAWSDFGTRIDVP
jgi:hypothetical protein